MNTDSNENYNDRLKSSVLHPLNYTSKGYYGFVAVLLAIIAWGGYAYITQLRYGLIVTGMNDVTMWGVYIVNFIFFIGISYAGTLVSAVLRITGANWRTPITRLAEVIAIVGIIIGGLMPFIDLGRPDRILNLFIFGRLESPLVWDIIAITTYLIACLIFLYLPLIPDMALMRDSLEKGSSPFRKNFFTFFAAGWNNTPEQKKSLGKGIHIMSIIIIPIAIFVHTVVAYIFAMTLRPGWNSTIYGPYFVFGAVFSGIAAILIVMAVFRKLFHLEEFIVEKHFRYLSYLLMTLLLFYAYFTFSEYLTIGYKVEAGEKELLAQLMIGKSAAWFWAFIIGGLLVPAFLIVFRKLRVIPRVVTASILIFAAMWVKRFVIVLGTLQIPLMPFEFGVYTPSWVEISISLAALAGFVLLFVLFAKFFPIISIWEVTEEKNHEQPAPGEIPTGNIRRLLGRFKGKVEKNDE
ncbi:MAG: NrfD/PsrC family molybdoenzyme membrane anchor subunit [Candidatus Humimicrobiaceae bacterium]